MKYYLRFLLFAIMMPVFGQKKNDPPPASDKKSAADSGDVIDFLVQSQLVDFRTSLNRDPFSPPTSNTNNNESFLIDEITIQGRIVVRKKSFALILDPYQNVREIPVGFKFLDGELIAVTENAIIFTQWDANSTNRSAQRTVTKPFKREEEKR
jgi:hypothetical protein